MRAYHGTIACCLTLAVFAAGRVQADEPSQALEVAPAQNDVAARRANRFTDLVNELITVEACLDEVNTMLDKADGKIRRAEYKAEQEAEKNIRLDSLGGAPVRWKEFYGPKARDFYFNSLGKPIKQPEQMKFIYRANDQRVAKAKSEALAAGNKADVLRKQRAKLEMERSQLWALYSLEAIRNRDIPQRSLYYWRLAAHRGDGSGDPFDEPRVKALQAGVVVLRGIERSASAGIGQLTSTGGAAYQGRVFNALRTAVDRSQKPATDEIILCRDTVGESTTDGKQIDSLLAHFKDIHDQTTIFCQAFEKLDDSVSAKEETQESERRRLQSALRNFAVATADLDQALTEAARQWQIQGEVGNKLELDEEIDTPEPSPPPAPSFDLAKLQTVVIHNQKGKGKRRRKGAGTHHAVTHKDGVAYIERFDNSTSPLTLSGNTLAWKNPKGRALKINIDTRTTDDGYPVDLIFSD